MIKNILFIAFVVLTVISCKKQDTGTVISKVWYAVELSDKYDLEIVYYSDKYFDTGILDTIKITDSTYTSTTGFWKAERFQTDREGGYYFWMKVNSVPVEMDSLNIFIFANDSSMLDSTMYFNKQNSVIELQGEIPKIFN